MNNTLDRSRITAAIWPWGTSTKEQMELAAKEVSAIGYESFESVKSAIYAFDLNLDAYREVLKRYNLNPVSFYFHFAYPHQTEEILKTLDRELDFIANLGVKRVCLQAHTGRPEVMDRNMLDFELNLIGRFAEAAKKFGITANLHPHNNTYVMYQEEIEYMLDNLDPSVLSFAPDTAHLVAGKCDPVEVIRKYAERINFTHLKDIPGGGVSSTGFAESGVELFGFTELGTGCVDFRAVFDILKEVNYDGPLCEELDQAPVSNAISAANNYRFILENY